MYIEMFRKFVLLSLIYVFKGVRAFPNGAPVEACIYQNHPNHPGTTSGSPASAPYLVTASSSVYFPGQTLTVAIGGPSFKGFFLQARANTAKGPWIGEFIETPQGKLHSECSAITHNHPGGKKAMVFTWKAPFDLAGKVVFLATILEKYDTYWVNLVAKAPPTPSPF